MAGIQTIPVAWSLVLSSVDENQCVELMRDVEFETQAMANSAAAVWSDVSLATDSA